LKLILVIDNYDSFTYNIVDLLSKIGVKSIVVRNDEITVGGVERINPDGIIISAPSGGINRLVEAAVAVRGVLG